MAVASKLSLCLLLVASAMGCDGNVVEGLPRDGGVTDDPSAERDSGARDAGTLRDATVGDASAARDAGRDASAQQQQDAGGDAGGSTGNDAGSSDTALNPGYLPRPNNGRQFTANLSDWQGNPRCDTGKVTFCDDFEGYNVGAAPGDPWTVDGVAVTVSDDQPIRGSKSMRFGPPSGMPSQVRETETFPTLQTKMFGRVFVYFFSDIPTTPSNAHWTLIQVGATSGGAQVRLSGQVDPTRGNKAFFSIGSDGGDSGDWNTFGREPESEVKKGAWYCLEWMFDGGASETRVWINNVEQLSLHTTKDNYRVGDAEGGKQFVHPTYGYLNMGYWVYQGDTQPSPAIVFLDELILDDEQIGCSL